jgi:predicted ATPase
MHLREVARRANAPTEGFPFNVPVVRQLVALPLTAPVTFFVGENGSGKSTLLEGIAAAAGLPTVGAARLETDTTLEAQRGLGRALTLTWYRRTRRGFFLRAEDFFGFATYIERVKAEMRARLDEVDREFADASAYTRGLARGPAAGSLAEMQAFYGEGLDTVSHGQAFLRLFQQRIVAQGLYLLDEPEAPLSPQNQLALLAMIHAAVGDGCQFIIATHAPILLAYPGATIFSFDAAPPAPVPFDELDHVRITRGVLTDPTRWLSRLLDD